jgi:hypothetical protein
VVSVASAMEPLSSYSLQVSYGIVLTLTLVLLGALLACAVATYAHHVLATRGHAAQRWIEPRYGRQLNPEAAHARKSRAWAFATLCSVAALVGLHVYLGQEFWPLAREGVCVDVEVRQLTQRSVRSRSGSYLEHTVFGVTRGGCAEQPCSVPRSVLVSDTISASVFSRLHEGQHIPFVVLPSDTAIHQVGAEASVRRAVFIPFAYAFIVFVIAGLLHRPRRQ